uniref:Antitoxin VapB n=1 Tax=Candidatus Kentrum sp. MB TaxID=2138164 RepID=A0A450XX05_9GAMM|nr:MAG: antitoxin VapB [Candidatus Kentron sp. MB]VFK33802.1 MAG: antitoxin VapB [Candidatus Kentron sp. MB]VFK76390.1 MAG: antitoxin VapB [Candidatus Kentron sp. MB]
MPIQTAKLFMNGNSQAVRLPKEFRFSGTMVHIRQERNEVILSPKPPTWDDFFDMSPAFGEDFLSERDNDPPQERELFR